MLIYIYIVVTGIRGRSSSNEFVAKKEKSREGSGILLGVVLFLSSSMDFYMSKLKSSKGVAVPKLLTRKDRHIESKDMRDIGKPEGKKKEL